MQKKGFFISICFIIITWSMNAQEKRYTPELLWDLNRLSGMECSPDGKQLLFGLTHYDVNANTGNRDLYTISTQGGNMQLITNTPTISEFEAVWTPDGKKIAFLAPDESGDMQIFTINPDGSKKTKISAVKGGIEGFKISADMSKILYTHLVKLDAEVKDIYPDLPKANALIADDLMYRHWNAWTNYSYSHIFVADFPAMQNAIDIMEGERFASPIPNYGGMEEICFSPDGTKIVYTSKKKVGKDFALSTNSDIYIYDIARKSTTNLSSSNPGYDIDPAFSPNGKLLVWASMATDGFESDLKRIFIHNFDKGTTENYSGTFEEGASNFTFSKDGKILYFISPIKGTNQIFYLDIAKKQIHQLTFGQHDYTSICLGTKELYGTRESMEVPSDIYRIDLKTGEEKQLTFVNKEKLAGVASIRVEERWVGTTDGKQMLVWVILPPDFDKTKKYPAVLFCEGGPQSMVSQFFSYRWNFQMMASRGYVVVAPNRRGLPGFGKAWNDQISLDYGGQNMKDYLSAIDAIAKEDYVDENRLGCVGASYGGFSVYWLAGHHEKRFKAFIAHCGMFNFKSWYATTEELFFANHDIGGPFWEKPEPHSYAFSPNNFVDKWDTPIMVIHGGNDFRIPYTEGLQAYNIAQIKGIPSKLLYFPDETHFVLKPQNAILWQREFLGWLDKWLK